MTSSEIEKRIEKLTKEINKAKGDNTRLEKRVVKLEKEVENLNAKK